MTVLNPSIHAPTHPSINPFASFELLAILSPRCLPTGGRDRRFHDPPLSHRPSQACDGQRCPPAPVAGARALRLGAGFFLPNPSPFTRHSRVDSGPESWPPPVHSPSWPLRQGYRSPPALPSESRHADSPPLHPERIRGEVTRIYDFTKKPGRDAHVLGDPNSQGLPRTPNMPQKKRGCPPRSLFFFDHESGGVCVSTHPFLPSFPRSPASSPSGKHTRGDRGQASEDEWVWPHSEADIPAVPMTENLSNHFYFLVPQTSKSHAQDSP